MKTMSLPGILYSVSPAPYHARSLSPPTPMGASGVSFGPAINPSSETESPVRPFPKSVLLPQSRFVLGLFLRGQDGPMVHPRCGSVPRESRRSAVSDPRPLGADLLRTLADQLGRGQRQERRASPHGTPSRTRPDRSTAHPI